MIAGQGGQPLHPGRSGMIELCLQLYELEIVVLVLVVPEID